MDAQDDSSESTTPPDRLSDPESGVRVKTAKDVGTLVRRTRRDQGLIQADLAGLSASGNRFVVELERGKPTIQLQKVLDMLDLLGLEVVVRRKRVGR